MDARHGFVEVAFDVGHSSIGWAVLKTEREEPAVEGCGVLLFQSDDCLASQRRMFRRMRRHIRSTRLRVERLKRLLAHQGAMDRQALDRVTSSSPWYLAGRVLAGGRLLTWPELWDVLRWYAHNRGYDGNRRWSRDPGSELEDVEKVNNARALYQKHNTCTMAETFCRELGIDPLGKLSASRQRFKQLNAAFPREDVEREVRRILEMHEHRLPGVSAELIRALVGLNSSDADAWTAIDCPELRLRNNYFGSLLFGQLVPRFENRIIGTCPVMYERIYRNELDAENEPDKAASVAEKLSKVPVKECPEFYKFRWAMQVANIRVAGNGNTTVRSLTAAERVKLNGQMEQRGYLTGKQLGNAVVEISRTDRNNVAQLLTHPDAEEALTVDSVKRMIYASEPISLIWKYLPASMQQRAKGQWRRGRSLSLPTLRQWAEDKSSFDEAIDHWAKKVIARRDKKKPITADDLINSPITSARLTGRAPFHRSVMRDAIAFVFTTDRHPAEEGGPLFRSEEMRRTQLERALDAQTNNHLVRHRLKMLERLHCDILKKYAGGNATGVRRVTIEVNRDLRELSGRTAQEIAKDLGQRLANFKGIQKKLEEAFDGENVRISAGLLRKARIADDLNRICPYTGKEYTWHQLRECAVDKDHIVPRSERPSDSLESLVITFPEVNKMKGKRSALRFIEECQGKPVEGRPDLQIMTLQQYMRFVDGLDDRKGHEDDKKRKRRRKELLKLRDYVEKEFQPRDLTQTSHLVRLSAQVLGRAYQNSNTTITSLPGAVTGAVRKAWSLTGCLAGINGSIPANATNLTKSELRESTHLHHALDACVLALASHLLPRDGGLWELLVQRRLSREQQAQIKRSLGSFVQFGSDGTFRLTDLGSELKAQVRSRLSEKRVVQHIPADQGGLACDQTVWRVFDPTDEHPSSVKIARWLAAKKIVIPPPESPSVLIVCRKRRGEADAASGGKLLHETPTWKWVYDVKATSAVIGLQPLDPNVAKLKRIKAVKVLGDNWGLALDPEPTVIRPIQVWRQLAEFREKNGGLPPRVLRIGTIIRVAEKAGAADYRGTWMIRGIQMKQRDGIVVDFATPDRVAYRIAKQRDAFQGVLLRSLLKSGVEVIGGSLIGDA